MNKKYKILVIEDDLDAIEAIKLILESGNYSVVTAFDYEEGLSKVKSEKPDLLILDVMLPGKSGFDLSYEVRKDRSLSWIPVIMLTAVNIKQPGFNFSIETDGEHLPVDEFIEKPPRPEDLLRKIKALLEKGKSKWSNWPEKTGE